MVKIWVGVFWGDVEPAAKVSTVGVLRHQRLMGVSTGMIVALSLAIAVAAGPLYEFATLAAEQLLDVAGYVNAVRSA